MCNTSSRATICVEGSEPDLGLLELGGVLLVTFSWAATFSPLCGP